MNLVIDIGNTFAKSYVFDNDRIVYRSVEDDFTDSSLCALVLGYAIEGVIVSTTRRRDAHLEHVLRDRVGRTVIFDPATTPVPLGNLYRTPDTLGADRLAAAVEAAARFPGQDVLIFDFGTAITVDWVNRQGAFAGGNISLGYSARLSALHQMTARLPLCEHKEEGEMFGLSTHEAIQRGVFHSVLHEIEGYMARNGDKMIIFTGGESVFFEKFVKNAIFADCELVPKGLHRILKYNAL